MQNPISSERVVPAAEASQRDPNKGNAPAGPAEVGGQLSPEHT